jgi:Mg-chelatase subunit ChlD
MGGSTVRLPRQIPYCHAMEILLTGEQLSAERAMQMGLINKVVPAAELDDAVEAWVARLAVAPTRSLARASRCLSGLPGGGGTPLAAGIDAAGAVADAARRRGLTPLVVLLTDGRANVGRDGRGGRPRAAEEALAAGRMLRAAGTRALLIDTSPQPYAPARGLADAMGARYCALPAASAAAVSRVVRAAAGAGP